MNHILQYNRLRAKYSTVSEKQSIFSTFTGMIISSSQEGSAAYYLGEDITISGRQRIILAELHEPTIVDFDKWHSYQFKSVQVFKYSMIKTFFNRGIYSMYCNLYNELMESNNVRD